jgi:hypothetical protein
MGRSVFASTMFVFEIIVRKNRRRRAYFDNELLAERRREPLRHDAGDQIIAAPRREGDDDLHGLGRVLLSRKWSGCG